VGAGNLEKIWGGEVQILVEKEADWISSDPEITVEAKRPWKDENLQITHTKPCLIWTKGQAEGKWP